jgi:hypothetical protein
MPPPGVMTLSRRESRSAGTQLAYACFRALEIGGSGEARWTNGIYFHKVLSLLHRRLKQERIDLRFPHCWYFYGDEAVRSGLPYSVSWNHDDETLTKVGWIGRADFSTLPGYDRAPVDEGLAAITSEFPPDGDLTKLIDAIYTYAPFPFQTEFRELKGEFYDIHGSRVVFEEFTPGLLRPKVDEVLAHFPVSEQVFGPVAEHVATLRGVSRVLLESQAGTRDTYKLLVDFWEFFCYHLRTHPKANENVPGNTYQYWVDQLPARQWDYKALLGRELGRISRAKPEITTESSVRDFLAQWSANEEEFERLLEDPAIS